MDNINVNITETPINTEITQDVIQVTTTQEVIQVEVIEQPIEVIVTEEVIEVTVADVIIDASYEKLKEILKAGTNVTITPNDLLKTITIAASGGGGAFYIRTEAGFIEYSYDQITWTKLTPVITDIKQLADSLNLLFSGSYNDLSNVPSEFTPSTHGDDKHSETYVKDNDIRLTNDRTPLSHGSDKHTEAYSKAGDNVSDFNNDAGYITISAVPTKTSQLVNDSGFITAAAVPTNVSELNNDSGYINGSQVPANETDPIFSAWLSATPPLYTEIDPVFLASEAASFAAGDKNKLDGIEANANKYTHPATHPLSIIDPTATSADTPADDDNFYFTRVILGITTWLKVTGTGLKAELKTYFDTIYATITSLLNYKTYSGFFNRTDSVISIDSGTGILTIQPLAPATEYVIYTNGTGRRVIDAPKTVTITEDQTITYVYFDQDGVLQKSLSAWDLKSTNVAPVAIVYKDGTTYAVTDERHGYNRNAEWHNWAHNNIGAMYFSGLTGVFTNTTLSIAQGVIYDEDIRFDTGGTKTTTSLWYRNGASGMRLIRNSTTPYATVEVSPGVFGLAYDNNGTLLSVGGNLYAVNWVYASNDPAEPIYTVVSQQAYNSLNSARNATIPIINLSTAEWKLLYRVIYRRTTPGGVETINFIEAADFRSVQTGVPTSVAPVNSHTALIDRDAANSHPDTAITLTETYTGNLKDATTQKEANDKVDADLAQTDLSNTNISPLPAETAPAAGMIMFIQLPDGTVKQVDYDNVNTPTAGSKLYLFYNY
jgi:hypothetical protein